MKVRVTSHHGEIIQGFFKEGYALVTLPCPLYWSEAEYTPSETLIVPSGKSKVRAVLDRAGITRGEVVIESNIPEKWGLGSSTADMLAALRSAKELSQQEEASLLASIEGTDPVMFSDAVLFRPKIGEVVENFGALPPMKIIGFNTDPDGMDTSNATRPIEDIEAFERLRAELRAAIKNGDVWGIGKVATASAESIQITRPKKRWADIQNMAKKYGAAGIQVAHSGTVVGLLFAADYRSDEVLKESKSVFGEAWEFST